MCSTFLSLSLCLLYVCFVFIHFNPLVCLSFHSSTFCSRWTLLINSFLFHNSSVISFTVYMYFIGFSLSFWPIVNCFYCISFAWGSGNLRSRRVASTPLLYAALHNLNPYGPLHLSLPPFLFPSLSLSALSSWYCSHLLNFPHSNCCWRVLLLLAHPHTPLKVTYS